MMLEILLISYAVGFFVVFAGMSIREGYTRAPSYDPPLLAVAALWPFLLFVGWLYVFYIVVQWPFVTFGEWLRTRRDRSR